MGFARDWDDLKRKMNNQGEVMELSREMRKVGKSGAVYSGFRVPQQYGKILIRTMRFGNRPMDFPNYNYNPQDNTILVVGDYDNISILYKKIGG